MSRKNKNNKSLFDLPIKEQKRIMIRAAREANKAQRELIERYEQKYGKANPVSC